MNNFLFISYPLKNPWTNVYGVARSLLALGTLLTLLLNNSSILFPEKLSGMQLMQYSGLNLLRINYFFILRDYQVFARILAMLILLFVISGYRPRFSGILHFWISSSFATYCICIEGGDQITAILTLLLLPICFTDHRQWHWDVAQKTEGKSNDYLRIVALSTFLFIRVQVCLVYLHAATAKFNVREWIDGTATWYWFKDPTFGLNYWVSRVAEPLVQIPFFVAMITWGSLAIELMLFLSLFLEKEKRKYFLWTGIGFHFMILVFHGLFAFFFAMAGALILYLRPVDMEFSFAFLRQIRIFKPGDFFNTIRLGKRETHLTPEFKPQKADNRSENMIME
ncbi:sporulation-delaying protein SdpB family protein [Pedobacter jeongneungensis]|uniref:sporulation-delaying protein SdpB family protein n=1 Tax=Pedobacter jeongneungensis TaxID=947309 RepID=UPI0031D734A7